MARHSGYSNRNSGRSSRRKFVWARHRVGVILTPGAVSRTRLLDEFRTSYGADLVGATLVRVRGVMSGTMVATASGGFIAGGIVRTDISTAVDPAAEGPNAKPHADWFLYEPFVDCQLPYRETSGRMIDVKSSRKVEELDEEAFLYLAAPPSNTSDVDIDVLLSIGLKLP